MNNYNASSYRPNLIEKLNKIDRKVSSILYLARKNRGYKEKELGNIIGASANRIKSYEFDIKKLNFALFFMLCKELDIDINRLTDEIYSFI